MDFLLVKASGRFGKVFDNKVFLIQFGNFFERFD